MNKNNVDATLRNRRWTAQETTGFRISSVSILEMRENDIEHDAPLDLKGTR